jgi:RNase H-fold protein (predicted Holliday junction resolvase)
MASASSSFVQPAIPKFDGYYEHWAMLMENFIRSKEFWNLVEHGIPTTAAGVVLTDEQQKAIEDQTLKDLKAKNYLFQAIDRSILETILNKDTAKNIWDSLKQKYQGTTRVKRAQLQALRKEFEVLHMKVGETMNEYFARTLIVANKMKANGETLGDVAIIEKILRSLTLKFDYVVCSIEESKDIDTLTIDELQSRLLMHEQRMSSHIKEEQALQAIHESPSRGKGRGRGSFRGRGRGRGRQNFDKAICGVLLLS